MEVKEPSAKYLARSAYKQTEVGVIPEEWDVPLLDSVANRGSGHTPDKKRSEYWGGSIKWISLRDTGALDHLYIDDTAATITHLGIANSSAVVHPAGTVVLSRDAGVGKSAVMSCSMAVSQHFIAWQCGPRLNNIYLYYLLQRSKPEFERIAMGSTIKTIGLPFFRALRISLPAIAEQKAIAEALSDADALIDALEQLLAKKRQIKQGAMQELLTGQRRLSGFAGEWEETTLGDISERIIGGGTPSRSKPSFWNGNIPWMTVKDFAFFSPCGTLEYISKEGLESSASNLVPSGTLITSTRMAIGKAVIFDVDVSINQDLKAIYFRNTINPNFLYFWFQFNESRIAGLGSGSTVMGISLPELKKIQFLKPGHAEQTAIASILSDMDTEIEAVEAKLAKARAVKQGMMQELLTGRIRLV